MRNKKEIEGSSLKCLTHAHSGESVLLYILGKNTVFFQLEKEQTFLPSLYTLWKYPEVRPSQDFDDREIVRKEGYTQSQCCGSGSVRIHIHFSRLDPDLHWEH